MAQRQQGRRSWLAWTLRGLTVVLLAFSVAVGLTGGEPWPKVIGFVPVTIA